MFESNIIQINGFTINVIPAKANFIEPKIELEGFPLLLGSPKQVQWAEVLRKTEIRLMLDSYKNFRADVKKYYKDEEKTSLMDKAFEKLFTKRFENASAKEWIDQRFSIEHYYTVFQEEFKVIFKEGEVK